MMPPRGLEFRANLLPHLERRRRLFGEAGFEDVDERKTSPSTALDRDTAGTVSGYAAVFNSPSLLLDNAFIEIIMPGAFTRTLPGRDIVALAHHDYQLPLGRTGNGTLRVQEDHHGLRFDLDLPKTDPGHDMLQLVRRRDLTGVSFAFSMERDGDEKWTRENGRPVRRIYALKLKEISPCVWPAYPATSIQMGDSATARAARLAGREDALVRDRKLRLLERAARVA
jgi:HK97 family phage prohead protease